MGKSSAELPALNRADEDTAYNLNEDLCITYPIAHFKFTSAPR